MKMTFIAATICAWKAAVKWLRSFLAEQGIWRVISRQYDFRHWVFRGMTEMYNLKVT